MRAPRGHAHGRFVKKEEISKLLQGRGARKGGFGPYACAVRGEDSWLVGARTVACMQSVTTACFPAVETVKQTDLVYTLQEM
jgi:hypothetical protein